MNHPIISPKKLIEVALPLDAINEASAKEKGNPFLKGHPRNLHQWWARRPLTAARAIVFSQLIHDPEDLWRCQNAGKEPNAQVKGHWTKARVRLFGIIEELAQWENNNNEAVLKIAREEIRKAWRETCDLNKTHPQAQSMFNPECMPCLYDPFAGGGAIPLEAQRLGLKVRASDLNPVAVIINKALIEIPPKFANCPPVNPNARKKKPLLDKEWKDVTGLAEDVRHYGQWMQDEAFRRIGHLYPTITVTADLAKERSDLKPYLGEKLKVVAWLWARTVKSPNPAFSHIDVPLISTYILSSKAGKEAYVRPVVESDGYHFTVMAGSLPVEAKAGTSAGKRQAFRCLMSDVPISYVYIRDEGKSGRIGMKLMAIVAEGQRGRIYISPTKEHEAVARGVEPYWRPDVEISHWAGRTNVVEYGMTRFSDLFTSRQLVALTTFSDLVAEVREKVQSDAVAAGLSDDKIGIDGGGVGAAAYADAVAVFAAMPISKLADYNNSVCSWNPINQNVGHLFSKQSIPMVWDFPETSPFDGGLSFTSLIDGIVRCIDILPASKSAEVIQHDAASHSDLPGPVIVSTDPPYYDNICYSNISDFFYVWLRRSLRSMFPRIFSTVAVPKAEELIAATNRHGSKIEAEQFFLDGMVRAMNELVKHAHVAIPLTIYYAFKQSDTDANEGTANTGWETFLEAVLRSNLSITGTWPMRTERAARSLAMDRNALASSIILVCRPRSGDAETISRRQFIRELNATLPIAMDAMTRESEGEHSPVAPVDLSQAIIGPGIGVFSKYRAVLEADGTPMTVHTALQLVNRFLAEDDFDADTQFCLHWFEQYGWEIGQFGEADTLARAKGTSVDGVKQSGVLHSASGNVRLLKWAEYPSDWDPKSDQRLPIWEVLHQLIRVFNTGGETGAAAVFAAVQSKAEAARQLAYRLYTLCERKNWAEDARAYNEVVTSWSGIEAAAAKEPSLIQRELFDN